MPNKSKKPTPASLPSQCLGALKWTARLLLDSPVDENNQADTSSVYREDTSSVKDAVGILSGVFVALVFIAGSSYEISYITSSQSPIPEGSLSNQAVVVTVATVQPTEIKKGHKVACHYTVGEDIVLTTPKMLDFAKSWLVSHSSKSNSSVMVRLPDMPKDMQCVTQVAIHPSVMEELVNKSKS